MRRKKISLIAIFLTIWCCTIFSMGIGVSTPVYAGINYNNPSVSFVRSLEKGNYSVYVNVAGVLTDWIYGYSIFSIIKNSVTYLSISVKGSTLFINYTEERRLAITETGNYTFNFAMDGANEGDYLNYEVLMAETEIVYHPKTSIISEAPYGIFSIFLALIGVTVLHVKKRNQ